MRWFRAKRRLDELRALKVEAVNLRNSVLMIASRLGHGIVTQDEAVAMLREAVGPIMEKVGEAQAKLVKDDALRRS